MAKSKLNLENSALIWDEKRRYKVNSIVSHIGRTYQNLTGKNTEPGVGPDWFIPDSITEYSKLVYVNMSSPNLATIFSEVTPPVIHDPSLEEDTSNLYIGTDASTWIWNPIVSGYVTKSMPTSSNFYLEGTTIDAGASKTAPIERSGDVKFTGSVEVPNATLETEAVNKSQLDAAVGTYTDLAYTPSPIDGTVTSSTGTDATIPLADVTNAGLLTPAEKADIATALQPADITGKVPYTGATTNVDLGEFQIKVGQVEFDQTPTGAFGVGNVRWNDVDGTTERRLKGNQVTLQDGQEVLKRVVNKTGVDLLYSQYKVVRLRNVSEGGAQGQRSAAVLAQANTNINSQALIGVVTENIINNQEGFITLIGEVREINTTGSLQGETWVDGEQLYLSATIAGALTKVVPVSPNYSIAIATVDYAHATQGKISVNVSRRLALDVTLSGNNDTAPSETAVKTYVDSKDALKLDAQFAVDINRQGIVSRTETTIAFDGTNTFTITPTATTWSYYRLGIKYTITGAKSVVITGSPIADGTWFICIDSTDGSLSASQTVWTLTDGKVPIASINFNNALTPKYWLADERHTAVIDNYMQYYLHNVDGARSLNTPTLAGYTVNTDTNVAKTFSISAGTLVDQDYVHNLPLLADPDGTAADYVVWYRTAPTVWAWKASNMPFAYNTGTDWIQYDVSGTMTDATGGAGGNIRFVNSYLLLTNKEGASRFTIVSGRGIFTTLAAAQAESIGTFDWTNFPIQESVIAYQLTWTTTTSTSQGKCRLAATPTLVNISTVTNNSSGAGTDHNTLSNLQGGTIGEYYHVTAAEKSALGTAIIYPVTETGASFSLTDAENGKITILTASCTVTIPNGLIAGFEHTIVTLAGVTLTVALGGSVTLFNNAGTTMAEKLSCTIKNRTATNQYITAGNL